MIQSITNDYVNVTLRHRRWKKADFYQRRHNRKAQRLIVISPMVDKKAMDLAKDMGILVYSYVEDIEPEVFSF